MSMEKRAHRLRDDLSPLQVAVPALFCCFLAAAQLPHAYAKAQSSSAAATDRLQGSLDTIKYENGFLTVTAHNASLNQIVHEIAQKTGMKVSGRVSEERVFGTYGPEAPSALLATLLDGSGSNVLIVQNSSHLPTELILTPRVGGPTPPNASSQYANDNSGVGSVQQPPPSSIPLPNPAPQFNSRAPNRGGTGGVDTNPAATSPSSTTQQVVFPPVDATNPPATATTTPTNPDPSSTTPKTPQQIFEQLQKLRQQQSQQNQSQPQ